MDTSIVLVENADAVLVQQDRLPCFWFRIGSRTVRWAVLFTLQKPTQLVDFLGVVRIEYCD